EQDQEVAVQTGSELLAELRAHRGRVSAALVDDALDHPRQRPELGIGLLGRDQRGDTRAAVPRAVEAVEQPGELLGPLALAECCGHVSSFLSRTQGSPTRSPPPPSRQVTMLAAVLDTDRRQR